jgi:flagellar biosynthetic protein FlhB
MLAAAGLIAMVGSYGFNTLFAITQFTLSHLNTSSMTPTKFNSLFAQTLQTIFVLMMPILLTLTVASILSNLAQVRPLFTTKPLTPNLGKLNPLPGFKRMFSMRSFVELAKSFVKLGMIGLPAVMIIQAHFNEILSLHRVDIETSWAFLGGIIVQLMLWACLFSLALGAGDWWYQVFEHEKGLKMTRQEVLDERRNTEGDPRSKSRRRQIGVQMLQKRQLASVPKADVVINNPTHYSVAIQYDPDVAPSPRVVAKGVDHFAMRIREIAQANQVPMVENVQLARSLYAMVEVEHMIPPELFVAVAEVLAYVFNKNKGRRPRPRK